MLDSSIFVQHFGQVQSSLNIIYNKFALFIYLFAYLPGGFSAACLVEAVLLEEVSDTLQGKLLGNKTRASSDVFSCIHYLCLTVGSLSFFSEQSTKLRGLI